MKAAFPPGFGKRRILDSLASRREILGWRLRRKSVAEEAGKSLGTAPMMALRTRVEVDHALDPPPADSAEAHGVAGEHDAVRLRPIQPAGLVRRALECSDLAGELSSRPAAWLTRLPLPEERVDFRLRRACCQQPAPLRLDLAALFFVRTPCPMASGAVCPAQRDRATSTARDRACAVAFGSHGST